MKIDLDIDGSDMMISLKDLNLLQMAAIEFLKTQEHSFEIHVPLNIKKKFRQFF